MRKGNNPERKEPYGVKLTFEVPNRIRKPFEGEISGNFCLIIEREVIIQVEPRGEATFDVFIESFETREEAEDFGNFFIDSLFWGALSDPSVLLEEQWVPWIWKESYSFDRPSAPPPQGN